MKPNDIRGLVQSMWLTTPEAELLGCIALTLAEILELAVSGGATVQPVQHLCRRSAQARQAADIER